MDGVECVIWQYSIWGLSNGEGVGRKTCCLKFEAAGAAAIGMKEC